MAAIATNADRYHGAVFTLDGFHITRKQLMAICRQAIGDNPVHPPGKWTRRRVEEFNR